MSPRDFYEMCPEEWWRLYEMKRPRDPANDYAGKLTEADVQELYELIHG